MTDTSWNRVGRALLGRWPAQVATWGEEGIAAFVEELQADGLTPDGALMAIRTYRPAEGKDFPPSVPAVSALAHADPSRPTAMEAAQMIWGRGGVLRARLPSGATFDNEAQMLKARGEAAEQRAHQLHPFLGSFVHSVTVEWLRALLIDDEEYGALRRKDFDDAWGRYCEAHTGREIASLVAGRRGELGAFDPLAALDVKVAPRTLGAGSGA